MLTITITTTTTTTIQIGRHHKDRDNCVCVFVRNSLSLPVKGSTFFSPSLRKRRGWAWRGWCERGRQPGARFATLEPDSRPQESKHEICGVVAITEWDFLCPTPLCGVVMFCVLFYLFFWIEYGTTQNVVSKKETQDERHPLKAPEFGACARQPILCLFFPSPHSQTRCGGYTCITYITKQTNAVREGGDDNAREQRQTI